MALGDSILVIPEKRCPHCGAQMRPWGFMGAIAGYRCKNPDCDRVKKLVDRILEKYRRQTDGT